jgi:hypothetical protein
MWGTRIEGKLVQGFPHTRATSTKYVRGSRLLGQTEERGRSVGIRPRGRCIYTERLHGRKANWKRSRRRLLGRNREVANEE